MRRPSFRNGSTPHAPLATPSRSRAANSRMPECGPHFCSMKFTEDGRKYAAEQGIAEEGALAKGMAEKEFVEKGAEVYAKA